MVVPCLPKMDVYGRDFDVHSCVFSFSFSFLLFLQGYTISKTSTR